MKAKLFFLVIILMVLCYSGIAYAGEEITLTTYYPAPYGEYNSLSVGDPTAGYTATNPGELLVQGNVGIGTTSPFGKLDVLARQGGTEGSAVAGLDHQLVLGGPYNAAPNVNGVKLWIGDYDNDGTTVYPIYVEDENSYVDFWLRSSVSQGSDPTMYFRGNVGIGTPAPDQKLDVVGSTDLTGDLRFMGSTNKWIFHTPDDGRTTLYIAPDPGGDGWDWSKQTRFESNGNVTVTGNVGIGTTAPGTYDGEQAQLDVADYAAADDIYLKNPKSGNPGWASAMGGGFISGYGSSMNLSGSGTYTVLCWATYFSCEDYATALRLDGTAVESHSGYGGDSAGCDQNTIMIRLTGVSAGSHTWSLSRGSQHRYMWMASLE